MTQTQAETRTRTFSWTSPAEHAALLATTGGLELLRGMAAGELPPPPIMNLIGFTGMDIEEGSVTFHVEPQEFHYNPLGTVHGGWFATLLDSAMACAVQSTLPVGRTYATMEFKVNLVRPLGESVPVVRAEGKLVHAGQRSATARPRSWPR